jgi:hypothetical protein
MASSAETNDDAENGLIFMQEMIEFMKNTNSLENSQNPLPLTIIPLLISPLKKLISFTVATAQFGKQLHRTQGVNISFSSLKSLLFYDLDICSITYRSTIVRLFEYFIFSSCSFSSWYHSSW